MIYLPVSFFCAPFKNREPLQLHLVTARPAAGADAAVHGALRRAGPARARRPADRPPGAAIPPRPLHGDRPGGGALGGARRLCLHISRTTVTELFSGPRVPLLIAAVLTGAAALRYRKPLLDAIDRRFFREQFDARHILTLLVERIRSIRDSTSLAELVTREIDLALHLERISMLALDARSGLLIDPRNRTRRLDASGADAHAVERERPAPGRSRQPQLGPAQAPREGPAVAGGERFPAPGADPGARRIAARPDRARREEERPPLPQGGPPAPPRHRQQRRLGARAGGGRSDLPLPPLLRPRDHGAGRSDPPELPPRPVTERAKECPKCGALHPGYTVFCRDVQQAARAVGRPLRPAGEVPLRAADRHRRHGGGLQRVRPGARPPRGDQDAAPGLSRRRPAAAARGAHGGGGLPPPPRPGLRPGDLAGDAAARHGAARGGDSRPARRAREAGAPRDRGARHRHGRRPGPAPRRRHPPPRHQAEQHRLHPRRRPRS